MGRILCGTCVVYTSEMVDRKVQYRTKVYIPLLKVMLYIELRAGSRGIEVLLRYVEGILLEASCSVRT